MGGKRGRTMSKGWQGCEQGLLMSLSQLAAGGGGGGVGGGGGGGGCGA